MKFREKFMYRTIPILKQHFKERFYLFTFRERGRKGEREGEKQRYITWLPLARTQLGTWAATQACALTESNR